MEDTANALGANEIQATTQIISLTTSVKFLSSKRKSNLPQVRGGSSCAWS